MLMGTNLDVKQLDYAETAHASGKDLISLINEVLDQSKIESGRLELEAVPFDLHADLDKVVSLLSGKSHEKDIEVWNWISLLLFYLEPKNEQRLDRCFVFFVSFPMIVPRREVGCLCI